MSDGLFWAAAFTIVPTLLTWMVFGRCMARIERAIKADGKPRPCPWDGPGARIVWYAWAIALPVGRLNPLDDPLIDVKLVRTYANSFDRVTAMMMMLSSGALLAVTLASICGVTGRPPVSKHPHGYVY